tara:strand:- start:1551 stop:2096 length:546 start_codon:yes stop_codon:yes gene_type:complete
MARDTFFLRGQIVTDDANQDRDESTIDLGAFVNLGSTKPQVLRIHSIQMQVCDSIGLPPTVDASGSVGEERTAFLAAAITTKSTDLAITAMPQLNDDEVIFTSSVNVTNGRNSVDNGSTSSALDIAPQHLVNGMLVGVDTLYLYAISDDAFAEDVNVNFLLECSTEPISKENAVSLALSQS